MASVLVAEDEFGIALLVRRILEQQGHKVRVVVDGRQAVDTLNASDYDLLITDIAMPETDGFALTRSIRARKGGDTLKIIALSAFPAATTAAEASGFDLYLRKPIDPADLVDAAAKLTGR